MDLSSTPTSDLVVAMVSASATIDQQQKILRAASTEVAKRALASEGSPEEPTVTTPVATGPEDRIHVDIKTGLNKTALATIDRLGSYPGPWLSPRVKLNSNPSAKPLTEATVDWS